jgi:formate dehydrogenase iron-sulfur subunit
MVEITPGRAYGFFTDTSVCIGCKACEVACKEWNQLPGNEPAFLDGFDNTGTLDSQNWRHVEFIDNVPDETMTAGQGKAWLMMSDVCKHCAHASCMEVCPTGAIIRTEFDSVYIQPDTCNGCRDCISACPYNVIGMDEHTGVAQKCTLCYDRLQGGLEPACAKACPTQSIQFGPVIELREAAQKRVADLHSQGVTQARLYGEDESVYGGLNAFFLLMDEPEAYRLPNKANAVLPSRNNLGGYLTLAATAVLGVLGGLIALRRRRQPADGPTTPPPDLPRQTSGEAPAPAGAEAAADGQTPAGPRTAAGTKARTDADADADADVR